MEKRLTASELVHMIGELPQNRPYSYVSEQTKTKIEISRIQHPEGPIWIKRYDPTKGEGPKNAKEESISIQMLWRIANALVPGQPVNFDRVLGGSYNTRSALEALLAHLPQFYFCYPGRYESISSTIDVKRGHKHLMWYPDKPHESGKIIKMETDQVISEIPIQEIVFDALTIPNQEMASLTDANIKRRHSLIQIELVEIGQQLGFRTWVASNDRAIVYKQQRIAEMSGVIPVLANEKLISAYSDAIENAKYIDCIWFRNSKFMPAVMEIEHTTGITSGLTRMKKFYDSIPPFPTRWVVVAPDEDREKVLQEIEFDQFKPLHAQYCPYSAIDELYSLCQRRHLKGVTDEFLDCFFEARNN